MSALAAALTPDRRMELLDAHARAEGALVELEDLERKADPASRARLVQHEANHVVAIQRAIAEYRTALPRRAISRCPFTGEALTIAIDDAGLDGLWWSAYNPVRPLEPMPRTFVALTGAVALGGHLDRAPFVVAPGPAVPYVIPRLLDRTKAAAVVSSVRIGAHTGYAIAYFADPPDGIEPANDWGTTFAQRESGWTEAIDDPRAFDFDIAARLAAGRVKWIAQGDTSLTLRDGAAGCPYLGLRGERKPQYVQHGRVWT